MKHFINQTKGKFFTVMYKKADGEIRKVVARTGVKKHLKGYGLPKHSPDNITVWDAVNKGYRTLKVDNILSFKCGDWEVVK